MLVEKLTCVCVFVCVSACMCLRRSMEIDTWLTWNPSLYPKRRDKCEPLKRERIGHPANLAYQPWEACFLMSIYFYF